VCQAVHHPLAWCDLGREVTMDCDAKMVWIQTWIGTPALCEAVLPVFPIFTKWSPLACGPK